MIDVTPLEVQATSYLAASVRTVSLSATSMVPPVGDVMLPQACIANGCLYDDMTNRCSRQGKGQMCSMSV